MTAGGADLPCRRSPVGVGHGGRGHSRCGLADPEHASGSRATQHDAGEVLEGSGGSPRTRSHTTIDVEPPVSEICRVPGHGATGA